MIYWILGFISGLLLLIYVRVNKPYTIPPPAEPIVLEGGGLEVSSYTLWQLKQLKPPKDGAIVVCTDCNQSPVCVANVSDEDMESLVKKNLPNVKVVALPNVERWVTLDGKPCE